MDEWILMKFCIEHTDTDHSFASQIVVVPESFNYASCIAYIYFFYLRENLQEDGEGSSLHSSRHVKLFKVVILLLLFI
jgi:hypothetical protein